MHPRRSGDHRVFVQCLRPAVHQLRLEAKDTGVERDHVPGGGNLVRLGFDLRCLRRILLTRDLDTGLYLSQRDGGKMEIVIRYAFMPRPRRADAHGAARRRRSYRTGTSERRSAKAPRTPARRWIDLATSVIGEKQILQRPPQPMRDLAPLLGGHQNGRLDPASGHNLRPVALAHVEKFAKTRSGILNGLALQLRS